MELALRYLGNRQQQVPGYNPRRVSSRIVDDAWVLINNTSTSRDPSSSQVPNPRSNTSPSQVPNSNGNTTLPNQVPDTPVHTSPNSVPDTQEQTSPNSVPGTPGHTSPNEMPSTPGHVSPNEMPSSPGHQIPTTSGHSSPIQISNTSSSSTSSPISNVDSSSIPVPSICVNIPVPDRLNDNLSSSLPPLSSLDANMANERNSPKSPNLSESQPNLLSEPTTSQEASGSSEPPQRALSQQSVDNMSILAMSRTDVSMLIPYTVPSKVKEKWCSSLVHSVYNLLC